MFGNPVQNDFWGKSHSVKRSGPLLLLLFYFWICIGTCTKIILTANQTCTKMYFLVLHVVSIGFLSYIILSNNAHFGDYCSSILLYQYTIIHFKLANQVMVDNPLFFLQKYKIQASSVSISNDGSNLWRFRRILWYFDLDYLL